MTAEHALVDGKEVIDSESVTQAITEMRGDFKALFGGVDPLQLVPAREFDRLAKEHGD